MSRVHRYLGSVKFRLKRLRHRLEEMSLARAARVSQSHRVTASRSPQPFVASLTSYGSRLELVHVSIETLMRQTVQPERLILWVSEDVKISDLSSALQNQIQRGLEVRAVPDIGPYTKIIPALKEFPDRPILTVDDDSFYASNLFERLFAACQAKPQYVHCYRAHRMYIDEEGWPMPYTSWDIRTSAEDGPSFFLFPTGVGGVIYPPGTLHSEVLNASAFRELCPTADDVWLKAMALMNGVQACRLPGFQREFPVASRGQEIGLKQINVNTGRNDVQLRRVFEEYRLNERMREFLK